MWLWTWAGLGATAASAQPPASHRPAERSLPIFLQYVAEGACPPVESFTREVEKRAEHVVFRESRQASSTAVFVRLSDPRLQDMRLQGKGQDGTPPVTSTVGRRAHGTAIIRHKGQIRDQRSFHAADCAELAAALALSVALVLDALDGPPLLGRPTTRREVSPTPTQQRDAGSKVPASVPEFQVGAAGVAARVLDPVWMPGGRLWARVAWRQGAWQPSLQLGLLATASGVVDRNPGRYRWGVTEVSACPLGLARGRIEFALCAQFWGGLIAARGVATEMPYRVRRSWFAAGAHARVACGWGSGFGLEFGASLVAPLMYRNFDLRVPDTRVASTPPLAPMVSVGIAYM